MTKKIASHKIINKEVEKIIIERLGKAEEFYLPVRKIWKELNSLGYRLERFDEFLNYLKNDKRFELRELERDNLSEEEEEMEKPGFYPGPRVKLKKRKITKKDVERIILKHAQNIIDNLVKAYEVKPQELSPQEEDQLIEAMRKAKKLKEKISETFKKNS